MSLGEIEYLECPKCGAKAGEPCRTSGGKKSKIVHVGRTCNINMDMEKYNKFISDSDKAAKAFWESEEGKILRKAFGDDGDDDEEKVS
jgi:predicted nucleic-acid-binding Zn-ribbon protein